MNSALNRLIGALALDGFKFRTTYGGPSFRGSVSVRGTSVKITLQYEGTSFTAPPRVFLEDCGALRPGVIAHLDETNELCVVDRREYVSDRYAIAEQARGIVVRAAEVLDRALSAAGPEEIAQEFPRHWGGKTVRVSFGPFTGYAKADHGETFLTFQRCGRAEARAQAAAVVTTERRLSFHEGQDRPNMLRELLNWADSWDSNLKPTLLRQLRALDPADPYAIICAPNGIVGVQVMVSRLGPRYISALGQKGWSALLSGLRGPQLAVERCQVRRVDMNYILGTNSQNGTAVLARQRIVLIGCGAIGGFLSFALAQLGAGLDGGGLILIDPESLDERNIARHRLGRDQIGINKAVACSRATETALAGISVRPVSLEVEKCLAELASTDLIVDATGEHAIGDFLNAWRLERASEGETSPALLHVWIEGNGAGVQSYFSSHSDFGCYRCLQPELLERPRFPLLRDDADVSVATGCGEAPFSPYGPAAPMAAAALAANHAAAWAKGDPKPLLRTVRLSYGETIDRKPTNPPKSEKCPACAR